MLPKEIINSLQKSWGCVNNPKAGMLMKKKRKMMILLASSLNYIQCTGGWPPGATREKTNKSFAKSIRNIWSSQFSSQEMMLELSKWTHFWPFKKWRGADEWSTGDQRVRFYEVFLVLFILVQTCHNMLCHAQSLSWLDLSCLNLFNLFYTFSILS